MAKRRSIEELMEYSDDALKRILLTVDGKGRDVKEDALNILLEREAAKHVVA